MNTRRRGARGEAIAVRYLKQKGYRILQQNFRTTTGEVDIVCEKDRTVVFVEVKSWRSLPVEELARSIGPRKRQRIARTAKAYLTRDRRCRNLLKRFDVVLVRPDDESIVHLEGAFDEECRE